MRTASVPQLRPHKTTKYLRVKGCSCSKPILMQSEIDLLQLNVQILVQYFWIRM